MLPWRATLALATGLTRAPLPNSLSRLGALTSPTDTTVLIFPDPAGEEPLLDPSEQGIGAFVDLALQSGQTDFESGLTSDLILSYSDHDQDGFVDGTGHSRGRTRTSTLRPCCGCLRADAGLDRYDRTQHVACGHTVYRTIRGHPGALTLASACDRRVSARRFVQAAAARKPGSAAYRLNRA